jgi:hypothetical protein
VRGGDGALRPACSVTRDGWLRGSCVLM